MAIALVACCLALTGVACGGGPPSAPPDLPVDAWQRDTTPILTAGARSDDGLVETAVADPDVLYDDATGVWHLWYQTGRARSYTDDPIEMVIRHAHSADGAHWTVDPDPALTLPDDASAWDADYTETPTVVYDPGAPADRRYKLYYSGASE